MNDVEKNLRKNIGKKIKLARTKAEYTQEQLAEKLSLSGKVHQPTRTRNSFGSATTITNICKALNITSDFLFYDLIKSNSPIMNDLLMKTFRRLFKIRQL